MTHFEGKDDNTLNGNRRGSGNKGLTFESMKAASPQHIGQTLKLHIPILYSFLPTFIQQLLNRLASRMSFFSTLVPSWKRRNLILLGGYIYKFDDNNNNHPKGSPIPLSGIDVHLVPSIDDYNFNGVAVTELGLPNNYRGMFYISNLRTTTYFACTSVDDARTWVNSIREGRNETITRQMGHAPKDSYPLLWDHYDSLGQSLVKSKSSVRSRIEQQKINDIELVSIGGGPIPRGYYG